MWRDYVGIGLVVLFLVFLYYIFGWLDLPYKVEALEKQLKRIADNLEKHKI